MVPRLLAVLEEEKNVCPTYARTDTRPDKAISFDPSTKFVYRVYNQMHFIHFLCKISKNATFSIDFDGNTNNSYIGR